MTPRSLAAATGEVTAEGRQQIAELRRLGGALSRRRATSNQLRYELSCFIGDFPHALEALDEADRCALLDIAWMDRCPVLAPLRKEVRFANVRKSVAARAAAVLAALGVR